VGVSTDDLGRLFDPFYTTKPEGMGIGLSVSRGIIERHSGQLSAAPNDGPGMTVSFCLPCAAREGLRPQADGAAL
jgi:signal transduction histidine kinase